MSVVTRSAGCLGALPPHPTRAGLILDEHIAPDAPPVPAVVDWMSGVDAWPMYGNNQYGDCVEAGGGHAIESVTRYGRGATVKVTDADVLGLYTALTGFDPDARDQNGNNPTDRGTVVTDMLDYWRKVGIAGHRILAHGEIRDQKLIKPALNLFGCLIMAAALPASAERQFGAGEPWTVVLGSPIRGGHCFVVPYYADTPVAITWGGKQKISLPWLARYVTEIHAVVSPEWLDATGQTPAGLDEDGLGYQFTALTGQPSPFRRAGR